jgi:DNA-binding NarL/FixJ family response regulator
MFVIAPAVVPERLDLPGVYAFLPNRHIRYFPTIRRNFAIVSGQPRSQYLDNPADSPPVPCFASMPMLTLLLAEDHAVVREGLRAFLRTADDLQVVGEATNGREAVELAVKLRPSVIVMDVAMPKLNGCEATRQILLDNPAARILALSARSDDEYVARMVAVGAMGFVEKQSSGQVLLRAIRAIGAGDTFYSPAITKRLLRIGRKAREEGPAFGRQQPALTPREEEVLQLVAEGAPNKQIAAELGISVKTVDKHRQQLMNKLSIHDTAGLTRYAISSGTIECDVS